MSVEVFFPATSTPRCFAASAATAGMARPLKPSLLLTKSVLWSKDPGCGERFDKSTPVAREAAAGRVAAGAGAGAGIGASKVAGIHVGAGADAGRAACLDTNCSKVATSAS